MTLRAAPKPPVREKKPSKPLSRKTRIQAKTPIKKVNKVRLDKRTKQYKAYMNSWEWKLKRIACLTRDEWTCQDCGWKDDKACFTGDLIAPRHLHADHKTYARFGHENLDDLATLCDDCHMKKHAMAAIKPRFLRAG